MSVVVPDNLNKIYQSLNGYRKQMIRFYPDRSGVINQGEVLRYTFPKKIMSLDTLMKYFEFTSTASQSATSTRQGTHFPRNSASIIDTLTIFINGQVFENIVSYNHLFNIIYDNTTGYNYNCSGMRSLEVNDPSISYTLNATTEAITAVALGTATGTTDASVCDTKRPIQIRNWCGFIGTANRIIDLTNVEFVVEIRLANSNIMWKGIDATTPTNLTPSFSIDQYYMTIQSISFDDDYYQKSLDALKAAGKYTIVFKTFSTARSGAISKSSGPILQFSTTAKYLSKLYLTCIDKDFETINYLQNQGTSSTVITPAFSTLISNTLTNIVAFNQSKFFQKNASGLTESQIEINGIPVYPFPQPPHLIKHNNFDSLDLEDNNEACDYPGIVSLEQWTKYAFLQAVSFEHRDAWKNKIISGYPNSTGNLLTIKWSPIFNTGNTNNTILLAFAERVVMAKFSGNSVSIEY
jgi:hypothetical protein